jgi:hypothetical protein
VTEQEAPTRRTDPPIGLTRAALREGLTLAQHDRHPGVTRILHGEHKVGLVVRRGGRIAYAEFRGEVFPFWRYFEQTPSENQREFSRFLAALAEG